MSFLGTAHLLDWIGFVCVCVCFYKVRIFVRPEFGWVFFFFFSFFNETVQLPSRVVIRKCCVSQQGRIEK